MVKRLAFVVTDDPTETARQLVLQVGGVDAAHDCVTRAAKAMKKPRGAPAKVDTHWLLIAAVIKRGERCSQNTALKKAVALSITDKIAAAKMLRRLIHKLHGSTLEKFARGQDFDVTRERNNFQFSLRK